MTSTPGTTTAHVFRIYIKAKPEAIWDAITKPEWTQKYGYEAAVEYELHAGGAFRAFATEEMKAHGASDVVLDGEIIEADPPHKLVQTWRALWFGEGFTRLTYEINEEQPGVCRLTVTHDVDGAPQTAAQIAGQLEGAGGGWYDVLSDLKTLLETGESLRA